MIHFLWKTQKRRQHICWRNTIIFKCSSNIFKRLVHMHLKAIWFFM